MHFNKIVSKVQRNCKMSLICPPHRWGEMAEVKFKKVKILSNLNLTKFSNAKDEILGIPSFS